MQGKSRGFSLGNYHVLSRLGGGATAGVFLCEHKLMHHRVAVKVLDQQLLRKDANTLVRFRREARAAAALSHPNIVRTIDLDEDAGRHFLVMEYVEGVTLDRWAKAHPAAPPRVFVSLVLQALRGLQHIHESALIHRDLKPSNLLLDKQGAVKILDLGLAKFVDDDNDGLSKLQGANIMGTIDFMSPEQAHGEIVLDIRTDIYSLGATLYYLLTGGEAPFPGGLPGAKMLAIQFQEPPPIRQFRPDLDPRLEAIIDCMMEKDREERYQTPSEAFEALNAWMRHSKKKSSNKSVSSKARDKQPKKSEASIPVAGPIAESKESIDRSSSPSRSTWMLRGAALGLIAAAVLMWKPWSLGHKATAQTPSAEVPK
jgi:serine/threonine protein kinase